MRGALVLPATGRRTPEEVAHAKATLREEEARKASDAERIAEQVSLAADPVLVGAGWHSEDFDREWTDPPDESIHPDDLTYFKEVHAGGLDLIVVVESVHDRLRDGGRFARRDWRLEAEGDTLGSASTLDEAVVEAEIAAATFAVAILRALPADVRAEALRQLAEPAP